MLKNKFVLIGITALSLALISFALFKLVTSKKETSKEPDRNQIVIDDVKSDKAALKALLNSQNVPENQIYGAVIRLAQDGDEEALNVAKKLVNHDSKYLREGAAQALGYFSDEKVLEDLKKLAQDKEESVRVFAMESLSALKSSQREKILEDLEAQASISPSEKITLLGSLYKIRDSEEKKKKDLDQIVALARKSDSLMTKKAALKAISVAGHDPGVKELMVEKIKTSKDENVKAVAIRSLANAKDSWLKERLSELSGSSSPTVKIAALQSVHRLCPEARWNLLENVIRKEKEESVARYAFEELLFLERSKANALLQKLKDDQSLQEMRCKTASEYVEFMKSKAEIDVCH